MIKDKIINALPLEMQNDVDFNKLFSDSLFNGLETEYLQDKFLELKFEIIMKNILLKGILKLVLTYIFSTRDEGCFF